MTIATGNDIVGLDSCFRRNDIVGLDSHWIPAPRFRGDKFTPAKAGVGMTIATGNDNCNRE